jgi:hypothetical protein
MQPNGDGGGKLPETRPAPKPETRPAPPGEKRGAAEVVTTVSAGVAVVSAAWQAFGPRGGGGKKPPKGE